MSRGVRVPPADLRACASDGLTIRATAERLDIAVSTIWRRGRRLGIAFSPDRIVPRPRTVALLAILREGVETSPEIARRLGWDRNIVSVALTRLADLGLVRRGSTAPSGPRGGRPPIRWKVRQ